MQQRSQCLKRGGEKAFNGRTTNADSIVKSIAFYIIAFIFLHQKATLYGLVPRNQIYVPQVYVIASGILSDVSLTKGRTHAQTPGIFTMDLCHQTSQPFAEWKSYVEIGANSKSKSCSRPMVLVTQDLAKSTFKWRQNLTIFGPGAFLPPAAGS